MRWMTWRAMSARPGAKDKAGNSAAAVVRTVSVVDPCARTVTLTTANATAANASMALLAEVAATTTVTELTCLGSTAAARVCSVGGLCPSAAAVAAQVAAAAITPSAGAAAPPDVFEVIADTTKPVITLLPKSGGVRNVAAGGVIVDSFTVNIGTPFVDPGVEAYDAEDGDLTLAVTSFGSGNIDTAIVTTSGLPFIIEYTVSDRAGNAAVAVRRRVRVVNPCADAPRGPANLQENLCDDGTCSIGGVCPVVILSAAQLANSAGPAR